MPAAGSSWWRTSASNVSQKSRPSGTTVAASARARSTAAAIHGRSSQAAPSSYDTENVRIACGSMPAAVVTIAVESSPPERQVPTGTSERRRSRTASSNSSRKRSAAAAGVMRARREGSRSHQRRTSGRPGAPGAPALATSRCPAGSWNTPSKNVSGRWSTQSRASSAWIASARGTRGPASTIGLSSEAKTSRPSRTV